MTELDGLTNEALIDAPSFGRHLRRKLARHAHALSRELAAQVRRIYAAFTNPSAPAAAKVAVAAALAYFILPADALPDFLPALGFTDDAAVIGLALRKLDELMRTHAAAENARAKAMETAADLDALRLDLAVARRENARLRADLIRARGTAKAAFSLAAVLAGLCLWVVLAGG